MAGSRDDIRALAIDDAAYPAALRTIADPPPVLYVRGTVRPGDARAVAVVGTRRASAYGAQVARHLAGVLARNGVTVVSGLARGIDAAAHDAALLAGGRTLAVLGCGVDVTYPPEHRRLGERIVASGALLAEVPPGTPPLRFHFPRRNRLISGLCAGVVVVEGREDSGALITACAALEQGRDVFAVPGPIFDPRTAAPHGLLRDGAAPVTCAEDILDALGWPVERVAIPEAVPRLDGEEEQVFAHLDLTPQTPDAIAARSQLSAAAVARSLVALECRGLVMVLPGQRYVRRFAGGGMEEARPRRWSSSSHRPRPAR